jgi:hypothetical protein
MREHRPRHYYWFGTAKLSNRGKAIGWYVYVGYRDQSNVTNRILYVSIRTARGGGAAVRVDGVAVWLPRPKQAPCISAGSE